MFRGINTMKKLMIGLGLVIVILAGGLFYLGQNAPKIIQAVIEDQGSTVTQVSVNVADVDLSIADLKAGVRGLVVGNPAGFSTDHAISLAEISVQISPDSSADLIVVDEIVISAPEITYEIGSKGSNIDAIQSNVEEFIGPDTDAAAGPQVVINNLYIRDGEINVSAPFMGGKTLTTGLPEIHLTDIGKETDGASPAEVADQIISSITKYASSAAGSIDLSSLGLADISGQAVQDAVEDIGVTIGDDVGDEATDAIEEASGALKNLFNKK